MQRALCLKLAAEQNATSRFAAIFSSFDADRSGTLSQAELIAALQKLGVDESTAKKTAVALDYDGDGTCEYLEFAAACLSSLGDHFDEMLWHEFKALDFRGQGQLTTKAMAPLFEKLTPLVLSRKLKIPNLDTDGDGLVNFEEFCTFFGRPGASHRRVAAAEAKVQETKDSEMLDTFISDTPHATLDISSASSDGDKENSLDEGSGPTYTCWREMESEFMSPSLAGRTESEALLDPLPAAVELLRDLKSNFTDSEVLTGGHQERSPSVHSVDHTARCCLPIFPMREVSCRVSL
jgi:Ca2+-binding EF-hand superfamily protein